LAALSPQDLVELIEAEGVATKVEPTGKIFPVSNKAVDVLNALLRRLERSGATLALQEPVRELERTEEGFRLITPHRTLWAERVILTTGGQSYPGSGTTGDGYGWAARLGHTIIPPRPALTPITVSVAWVPELRGITVPDVGVRVMEPDANGSDRAACLAQRRGSFLFTHFGVSGPAPMDVSRSITGHPRPDTLTLACDFLPTLTEPELNELLQRESTTAGKKQLAGTLSHHLPHRLVETCLELAGMPRDRKAAGLSKAERLYLVKALKHLHLPVRGTLGFAKAEVTAGGVNLDEVDSRTMQSKLVPNLYLAGEVLDLDGPIGGYNFQAAFSTGWLAGNLTADARR
jgi:predicted Rossmann fold flavoprotein